MAEAEHAHPYAALFAGRWIGQTQGSASPAHVWEISLARRGRLKIVTRWENDMRVGAPMTAELVPDEAAFVLRGPDRMFKAVLVDPQHFIVPGWDTNDLRGFAGPDYDVVFSRPGLAELTARRVWEAYRAGQGEAGADGRGAPFDVLGCAEPLRANVNQKGIGYRRPFDFAPPRLECSA